MSIYNTETKISIYLRELKLSDIDAKYLSWVNDPSVTEYLDIGKKSFKKNDLIKYINESKKIGRYNYAVITNYRQNHIGNGMK